MITYAAIPNLRTARLVEMIDTKTLPFVTRVVISAGVCLVLPCTVAQVTSPVEDLLNLIRNSVNTDQETFTQLQQVLESKEAKQLLGVPVAGEGLVNVGERVLRSATRSLEGEEEEEEDEEPVVVPPTFALEEGQVVAFVEGKYILYRVKENKTAKANFVRSIVVEKELPLKQPAKKKKKKARKRTTGKSVVGGGGGGAGGPPG